MIAINKLQKIIKEIDEVMTQNNNLNELQQDSFSHIIKIYFYLNNYIKNNINLVFF